MTGQKVALGIAGVCLTGWLLFQWHQQSQAMQFVHQAAAQFRKCPDLKALNTLPKSERPLYAREFPNGEWVAIKIEHSCCSGAGFNAVVFVDSKKQISYSTTRNYCGYEGMAANMPDRTTPTLDTFYARLAGVGRAQYRP